MCPTVNQGTVFDYIFSFAVFQQRIGAALQSHTYLLVQIHLL